MSDKITDHLLNKVTIDAFPSKAIFCAKAAFAALLSISVLAQPAYAVEQEWWFDIEVILFERNLDAANISEKFQQSQLQQPTSDVLDLLTPYIYPDLSYLRAGLPYCRESNRLVVKTQYQQDFAFSLPVVESNESSTLEPNDQLEQDQQTGQSVVVESDEIPEESFQYEVATADIFTQSNETIPLTQTADAGNLNPSNTEQNNSGNLESAAEIRLARPPIKVEFIEWQIPSELLCSYAEQIDASFTSMIALQNDALDTQSSHQIKQAPKVINGNEWQRERGTFLLPTETMKMRDLYDKINKQRDISVILHLNWRQEVTFGREKAQTIRLFAGENFAEQFDANGLPLVDDTDSLFDSLNQVADKFYIPEQELALLTPEQQQALLARIDGTESESVAEDLFTRINIALADDTPINIDQVDDATEQKTAETGPAILKELWQLDGGISVYLRNVGRIPYLHIDSNLDFRQPIFDPKKALQLENSSNELSGQGAIVLNQLQQPNLLQSVNFNQLRRVISKQVHYFDHPLFGMVVRINRHRWPEAEQETDIN